MRGSIFVMGEQPFTTKHNLRYCYRCNLKFKSGDKIYCKLNKTTKRYHILCAENCNLLRPEIKLK